VPDWAKGNIFVDSVKEQFLNEKYRENEIIKLFGRCPTTIDLHDVFRKYSQVVDPDYEKRTSSIWFMDTSNDNENTLIEFHNKFVNCEKPKGGRGKVEPKSLLVCPVIQGGETCGKEIPKRSNYWEHLPRAHTGELMASEVLREKWLNTEKRREFFEKKGNRKCYGENGPRDNTIFWRREETSLLYWREETTDTKGKEGRKYICVCEREYLLIPSMSFTDTETLCSNIAMKIHRQK